MAKSVEMVANIHDQLLSLATPIGDLVSDPENARLHSEANVEAIMSSLREFGQDQPLVVQKQGMVVRKGNGRLEAARRLGWTHIAALIVDENRVRAIARALADNRTAELAEWDFSQLNDHFVTLRDHDVDLQDLGWAPPDVVDVATAAWEPPPLLGDLDAIPEPPADPVSLPSGTSSGWANTSWN